jgi:PAS domain S-box-containing protein
MSEKIRSDRDRSLKFSHLSIEEAAIGNLWIDAEGGICYANKSACQRLEYEFDELTDLSYFDINRQYDKNRWAELRRKIGSEKKHIIESEYSSRSGESLAVQESSNLIDFEGDQYISLFFCDISACKGAELALEQSRLNLEARNDSLNAINKIVDKLHGTLDFQSVVEESVNSMMDYIQFPSVVIFRLSEDGSELELLHAKGFGEKTLKIGSILPVEGSLTGLSVIQKDVVASYDITTDTRLYSEVQKELVKEGLTCAISLPVIRQDKVVGAMNLITEHRDPLSDYEKETLLSIGKAIGSALANAEQVKQIRAEITERKQAEKELRSSRQKWRSLVENFHDIIFIDDYEGNMLYANPSLEEQTGLTIDDFKPPLGENPFIHPDDAEETTKFVKEFAAGENQYSGAFETRIIDKWEQIRWYSTSITKVEYEGTPALLYVNHDMTPRKNAEIALQEALAEVRKLKNRLQEENIYLKEEIKLDHNFDEIIGASGALKAVMEKVDQVAPTDATVLILGETGTGKELISRAVHERSQRRDSSMIKVNCSAIPKELFESEFFGHVKGAFTGALKDRIGRFQLANGGTLFLDEVGEIPLELQGKLLRVLQDGQFERVGDDSTREVNVRIISSTNRNLEEEISEKNFRQDLYFRLSVFPIEVPPLRDRLEDIPALSQHFMQKISRRIGIPEVALNDGHFRLLQQYQWPGNIRELENVIERALITSRSGQVNIILPDADKKVAPMEAGDEPGSMIQEGQVLTQEELHELEVRNVVNALDKADWKIYGAGGAAELLGIKPSTLTSRIKTWGIDRDK